MLLMPTCSVIFCIASRLLLPRQTSIDRLPVWIVTESLPMLDRFGAVVLDRDGLVVADLQIVVVLDRAVVVLLGVEDDVLLALLVLETQLVEVAAGRPSASCGS